MFRSIGHLIEQIHEYKLEAFEDQIVKLAKPSVLMTRTKVNEGDIPIGASKLGGNPDLPKDFKWPHWKDKPLTFIAQFKLSEVAEASSIHTKPNQLTLWDMSKIPTTRPDRTNDMLPETGMFYFFYDMGDIPYDESEG